MSRLFFALWPNDATRILINKVVLAMPTGNGRRIIPENFHITLEFLGDVPDQDRHALIEKAGKLQHKSFDLELTQTGWWRKPQILWIGTNFIPTPLLDLVESIRQCVRQQGLKTDYREYKPHVTVARKVKKKINNIESFHIPWHVDNFVLVESQTFESGAVYQVINKWFLT